LGGFLLLLAVNDRDRAICSTGEIFAKMQSMIFHEMTAATKIAHPTRR
jgi:hypothetical protein